MSHNAPDLDEIRRVGEALRADIARTPLTRCAGLEDVLDNGTEVYGKLEFLQRTGTFKARGALTTVLRLDDKRIPYSDYGGWAMSGWEQIFFYDPDGNVIEVHQAPA